MPRNAIYPIEEEEYQMKYKNACPRLQKWKTRFEEADFDVNKLRNQAINKSPVYVAIQRGSRNIQIRTKTSTYLWRLWIQQGRRVNDEDLIIEPIRYPQKMLYKHQVTLAQNERSPTRTPRKTIPVTPLKTPKKSPVKVSVIRAQTEQYIGDKFSSSKYNVPTLTLTPVPLNVILRKKAKIVGKTMHRWAKGRWINQDPSMLSVPGNDPFGYETSSETEDEDRRERRENIVRMMKQTPPSPSESLKKRIMENVRAREAQQKKQESSIKDSDSSTHSSAHSHASAASFKSVTKSPPKTPSASTIASTKSKTSTKSQPVKPTKSPDKSPPTTHKTSSSTARSSEARGSNESKETVRSIKSSEKSPPKTRRLSEARGSTESSESIRKLKGVGHAIGLMNSPKTSVEDGEEHEKEKEKEKSEDVQSRGSKSSLKEEALKKIKAVGKLFSPPKSPSPPRGTPPRGTPPKGTSPPKGSPPRRTPTRGPPTRDSVDISYQAPTETEEETGTETEKEIEEKQPRKRSDEYKDKIRAIGQMTSYYQQQQQQQQQLQQQQLQQQIEAKLQKAAESKQRQKTEDEVEGDEEFADENLDDEFYDGTEPKATGIRLLMTKMKFLAKISPRRRLQKNENVSGMSLLMTKIRFLAKLSPKRRIKKSSSLTVLKRKIGILIKLCRKKTQLSEEIEEPAEGKDEKRKSKDEMKKSEKEEQKQKEKEKKDENAKDQEKKAKDQEEGRSFIQKICPCVGKKEEPEILEYQSESRESF